VYVARAMRFLNCRNQTTPDGTNRGTDDARRAAAAAIAAQPNAPEAHIMMAWTLAEGLEFSLVAKRLDPSFPIHCGLV
jgi:hypothetical protein